MRFAVLALVLGAIAIGFAPIFVRLSISEPVTVAFYRTLFAIPPLFVWSVLESRRGPLLDRAKRLAPPERFDYVLIGIAGLAFACDMSVWHHAIHFTSVANATLLANLSPVFVTIFAAVFYRERIRLLFVFGLIIAFTGMALLVGGGLEWREQNALGDLLGVITAFFYATYFLCLKRLRARFSSGRLMAYIAIVATVAHAIIALALGEKLQWVSLQNLCVLIALAWISHAGGQGLIAFALGRLPVSFSTATLLIQPVTASLLAYLLFDEIFYRWQWVGAACVLIGIYLAGRATLPPNKYEPKTIKKRACS